VGTGQKQKKPYRGRLRMKRTWDITNKNTWMITMEET
jgi:hypothetical protein